jgi:hypothetical protein
VKQTSDGAKIFSCSQQIRTTNGEEDRAGGGYRLCINTVKRFCSTEGDQGRSAPEIGVMPPAEDDDSCRRRRFSGEEPCHGIGSSPGDRTGQLTIADNAPGTPQAVSLDGTGTASAPPVTIAPQSSGGTTATVNAGGPVTYKLTLTTATYSGVVGLSCAGAPALATCSVDPAAPQVAAGTPTAFAVTVTTGAAGSSAQSAGSGSRPGSRPNNERGQIVSAGLGLAILLTFPVILSIRRYRSVFAGLVLLGVTIGFGLAGCGSGSAGNSAGQANTVAAGTYQLTITAAAGKQSATEVLTLIVK